MSSSHRHVCKREPHLGSALQTEECLMGAQLVAQSTALWGQLCMDQGIHLYDGARGSNGWGLLHRLGRRRWRWSRDVQRAKQQVVLACVADGRIRMEQGRTVWALRHVTLGMRGNTDKHTRLAAACMSLSSSCRALHALRSTRSKYSRWSSDESPEVSDSERLDELCDELDGDEWRARRRCWVIQRL